jgi:hypothetical protein
MRRVIIVAGASTLVAVALASCGTGTRTQPYCWPNSECAKVSGVVEQCGGPAGKCSVVPVVSIGIFDSRGRTVTGLHAGTGHKLDSFRLETPIAGHYLLETTVGRYRVRRSITLRLGQTVRANLIEPIP